MMRCRPAIVIVENNHVLLMKYCYGNREIFNFPGGNAEGEELFVDTLERECQEELGIGVEIGKMICMGQMSGNPHRKQALHVLFEGKIISGIPILQPQETTANEIVWLPVSQLHTVTLYPNIGEVIQDYLITGKTGIYLGEIKQEWVE
ncbi:MAG: hypothetical protein RI995_1799 [Bacteroidota bacterium]